MTDVTTNGLADGTGTPTPPLKLLTQYLKDLSFENPGAPMVHMLRGEVPRAQLSLDVRARTIAPMQYEVSLVLGISAQREQETVYLVELEYAGLFDVTGVPEEHVTPLLMIEAPRMLFVHYRATGKATDLARAIKATLDAQPQHPGADAAHQHEHHHEESR